MNAKFLGLLKAIGGSERVIPVEQALEEVSLAPAAQGETTRLGGTVAATGEGASGSADFAKICFYISPIGEENSEDRRHADFLMEYIIKPAVAEFGLTVVPADQNGQARHDRQAGD
ncbi:MAG: hypothetical protein ABSH32_31470 [Bryobacteraceae bacterium]